MVYSLLFSCRLVSQTLYCNVQPTYKTQAYLPRRYQVCPLVLSTSIDICRWCTAFCSRVGLSPKLFIVMYNQPIKHMLTFLCPLVLSTSIDICRWCTAFCSRVGLSPKLFIVCYNQPIKHMLTFLRDTKSARWYCQHL